MENENGSCVGMARCSSIQPPAATCQYVSGSPSPHPIQTGSRSPASPKSNGQDGWKVRVSDVARETFATLSLWVIEVGRTGAALAADDYLSRLQEEGSRTALQSGWMILMTPSPQRIGRFHHPIVAASPTTPTHIRVAVRLRVVLWSRAARLRLDASRRYSHLNPRAMTPRIAAL